MALKARMVGNEAVDVTGLDPAEIYHADLVEAFVDVPDNVTPGSIRNEDGSWTIAAAWSPPAQPILVNKFALMTLFTAAERATYYAKRITALALTADAFGPDATDDQKQLAQFYDYLQQFDALPDSPEQPGVNLSDPRFVAAITAMFTALGIITSDRVAAILSNQPPPAA